MTAKSRRRTSLVLVGVGVVAASALLLGPAGRNPRESVAPRFVALSSTRGERSRTTTVECRCC